VERVSLRYFFTDSSRISVLPDKLEDEYTVLYNKKMANYGRDISPEFRDLIDDISHNMFRDLDSVEIIGRGPTPTLDWTDDKFLQYSMYNIKQLSNDEIKVTGVELIKDLKEHITCRTGYNILCLAFSIQSRIPGKKYAISDTGNFQDTQALPQDARDQILFSPSAPFTAKWDFGDDDVAVKAYCYVAFSLLRLLTKSHVAYYRAQQHIQTSFLKFYGVDFPGLNFSIDEETINGIQSTLRNVTLLRNASARIFYNVIDCARADIGMLDMLALIHCAYTGLHSYRHFSTICRVSNIKYSNLLEWLRYGRTRSQVEALDKIMKEYECTQPAQNLSRRTWRYGRIYEDGFMKALQTKNCTELCYILTQLVILLGQKGDSDPMEVAALKGMGQFSKDFLDRFASEIFKQILAAKDDIGEQSAQGSNGEQSAQVKTNKQINV
jgi:hypothetical protein